MVRQSEHRDTSTLAIPSALVTAHPTQQNQTRQEIISLGAAKQDLKILPRNIQARDNQAHWKCWFPNCPLQISASDVTKSNLTTSNTKLRNKNGKNARDIPTAVEMQHGREVDLPGKALTSVSHESWRTLFLVLRFVWGTWPSSSLPFLLLFLQEIQGENKWSARRSAFWFVLWRHPKKQEHLIN